VDSRHPEFDTITGQKPSEDCAVIGITGTVPVFSSLVLGLKSLQHRGQESAGISLYNGEKIKLIKGPGLVSDVFGPETELPEAFADSSVGIGHTRYSTKGSKSSQNAGPFALSGAAGYFSVSHNGEITNAEDLRRDLKRRGVAFVTNSDTEVLLAEIARDISQRGVEDGLRYAMSRLKGAYSLALLINERLFAVRDPHGFRPLVIGKTKESFMVASESCTFDVLGGELIRDVLPGEIIELTPRSYRSLFRITGSISHCMFEYVYFARPDSIIDSAEVFRTRIELGRILAREHPVDADVVIPVPDSGRAQSLGFSEESGIKYSEGLIKNRYSGRTFIMPTQEGRVNAIRLKLNPIKSAIEGKRVVLVDDSIVRGNTIRRIVSILRKQGAKEVHVRIGSPMIVAPCYYGVDMKTRKDFIARDRTPKEICKEVGADSLEYLSIDGLIRGIGMPSERLCKACLTGVYPEPIPEMEKVVQRELETY